MHVRSIGGAWALSTALVVAACTGQIEPVDVVGDDAASGFGFDATASRDAAALDGQTTTDVAMPGDASSDDAAVTPTDAGGEDALSGDAGPIDTGAHDAQPIDTGVHDAQPIDTGVHDAQPVDSGPSDTGIDAGSSDSGLVGDSGARPTSGCGMPQASGLFMQTMTVGGTARTYLLFVPTGYDPTHPYPLLFGWHGLTGDGATIRSKNVEVAANNTAIFVYPDGLPQPPTGDTGWNLTATSPDLDLFDQLETQLAQSYCVDQTRVFSYGFSDGAFFSNLLGCLRANVVSAIAVVEGVIPPAITTCPGLVAVWQNQDDDDTTVTLQEGTMTRDHWLAANGCSTTNPAPIQPPPCVAYQGCATRRPVDWCESPTGGHTWPSYASLAIWSFFSAL
jgi:poly(3-hydroxybutyrate) depolymerase